MRLSHNKYMFYNSIFLLCSIWYMYTLFTVQGQS